MGLPFGFKFAERKALALLGHGLGWGGPGLYTRRAGMQPLFRRFREGTDAKKNPAVSGQGI
jgi:hypothetical protein